MSLRMKSAEFESGIFFFFENYIKYKQLFQYIFFACYKNVELVYVAAE